MAKRGILPFVLATFLAGCAVMAEPASAPIAPGPGAPWIFPDEKGYVDRVRPDFYLDEPAEPVQLYVGTTFWLDIIDLDKWIESHPQAGTDTASARKSLVLVLNSVPFLQIHSSSEMIDKPLGNGHTMTHLRFTLKCDVGDNRPLITSLVQLRHFNRSHFVFPVEVTVQLPSGEIMKTRVSWNNTSNPVTLHLIQPVEALIAIGIVLLVMGSFAWLARHKPLLRDVTSPPGPNGKPPFSLARVQMAFWFFLVFSAFWLIYLSTQAPAAIPESVLYLIGISSATAVGAAVIDVSKMKNTPEPNGIPYPLDPAEADKELRDLSEKLRTLDLARPTDPQDDKAIAAYDATRAAIVRRQHAIQDVLGFMKQNGFQNFFFDLLTEQGNIAFHRFQVIAWTLVLGIYFCINVYQNLVMPEFDSTLLTLMGISAGTYLGFKIPSTSNVK